MKDQNLKDKYPDAQVIPVMSFGFFESGICIDYFLTHSKQFMRAFYKDFESIRLSDFNLSDTETVFDDKVALLFVERINEKLKENKKAKIFLEDFPVTLKQFMTLEEKFGDIMQPIYCFNISRKVAKQRAKDRYYCPKCQEFFMKSLRVKKLTGPFMCPCPSGSQIELVKRKEDEEHETLKRFDTFSKHFKEIRAYGAPIHDTIEVKNVEDLKDMFTEDFKVV